MCVPCQVDRPNREVRLPCTGRRRAIVNRFGERLSKLRKDRGWSQTQLAELLTAHGFRAYGTTVAKIEANERDLRVEEAAVFADVFGCSIDHLLGRRARPAADRDFALRRLVMTLQDAVPDREALRLRSAELAATDHDGTYADLLAAVEKIDDTLALLTEQLLDTRYVSGSRSSAERGHHA
jgi:transcriptional regulator with XRE-family HTH domain